MATIGTHKLEELYKSAAGLRISKNKVKSLTDYIDEKFHDLLIAAQANAKLNGRDIIQYSDMPFTKAFRESMQKFEALDETLELKDILEYMATLPPKYDLETVLEEDMPKIVGTLVYILANVTKELSTDDKVVSEEEHEKAETIMNLMI